MRVNSVREFELISFSRELVWNVLMKSMLRNGPSELPLDML